MRLLFAIFILGILLFSGHSVGEQLAPLDVLLNNYSKHLTNRVVTIQYENHIFSSTEADDPDWHKLKLIKEKWTKRYALNDSQWRISIQGDSRDETVFRTNELVRVDSYSDQQVQLTSYADQGLPAYAGLSFNFQLAIHHLSNSSMTRITVGYPVVQAEL